MRIYDAPKSRSRALNFVNLQLVFPHKTLRFTAGENAFRGPDRPHATGAEGTSPAEAAGRIFSGQEAGNTAGVKGVAGAGADVVGRIDAGSEAQTVGDQNAPVLALRDHDGSPGVAETPRLLRIQGR